MKPCSPSFVTSSAAVAACNWLQSSEKHAFLEPCLITVTTTPFPGDATRYMVTLRTDISNLPLQVQSGIIPMPSSVIERTAVVRIGGY